MSYTVINGKLVKVHRNGWTRGTNLPAIIKKNVEAKRSVPQLVVGRTPGKSTARRMSVLLQDLERTRSDRSLDTGERHHTMQRLADEAKALGLKGRWNLLCNRTQCLRPAATWYNRGSYAFYCADCAHDLNRVNRRDAEDLLGAGQALCIEVATASQAENLHVMP